MDEGSFPQELRETATSVMRALGRRVSRVEFTRCLLERLEVWYDTFLLQGAPPIIERWESLARIRGKSLEVRSFGKVYRGVAEGLDSDGALILQRGRDDSIRIVAGDLT